MFRFDIRELLPLAGYVLAGALFCGCWNAAVSSDAEECVYQWMRGIAFGGVAGAIVFWVAQFWNEISATRLNNGDE